MRRRTARSLASAWSIALALVLVVAGTFAACSPLNDAPGPTSRATPVPTGTDLASSEPSNATAEPGTSATTQTDTDWGRIWDALPPSFLIYPGSSPTTEIGSPASGQFVVPASVATATTWMKSALGQMGLRTTVSGPLEDGSVTLDSVGQAGCAVKTTIAPTGAVTTMTILYGANCPFAVTIRVID